MNLVPRALVSKTGSGAAGLTEKIRELDLLAGSPLWSCPTLGLPSSPAAPLPRIHQPH